MTSFYKILWESNFGKKENMATKTFEELKQLATVIRDMNLKHGNTAQRVGTFLIDEINKIEEELKAVEHKIDKDSISSTFGNDEDKVVNLSLFTMSTNEFNLSLMNPTGGIQVNGNPGGNRYTLVTAITALVLILGSQPAIGKVLTFISSETGELVSYRKINENEYTPILTYKELTETVESFENRITNDFKKDTTDLKKYIDNKSVEILPESVTPETLSPATKQLIDTAGGGSVTNLPDDEDLTVVDNVLKFKDRAYQPTNYSGLGRKILRKNMINGVNILTQEMINEDNTIYELQYEFDLDGATIMIPETSSVFFFGGIVRNGTFIGSIVNDYITPDLFGCINVEGSDDSESINNAILCGYISKKSVTLNKELYYTSKTIKVIQNTVLNGNGAIIRRNSNSLLNYYDGIPGVYYGHNNVFSSYNFAGGVYTRGNLNCFTENITLSNFIIDGNLQNNTHITKSTFGFGGWGLDLRYCKNVQLYNIKSHSSIMGGFMLRAVINGSYDSLEAYDNCIQSLYGGTYLNTGNGFDIHGDPAIKIYNNIHINNCHAYKNADCGFNYGDVFGVKTTMCSSGDNGKAVPHAISFEIGSTITESPYPKDISFYKCRSVNEGGDFDKPVAFSLNGVSNAEGIYIKDCSVSNIKNGYVVAMHPQGSSKGNIYIDGLDISGVKNNENTRTVISINPASTCSINDISIKNIRLNTEDASSLSYLIQLLHGSYKNVVIDSIITSTQIAAIANILRCCVENLYITNVDCDICTYIARFEYFTSDHKYLYIQNIKANNIKSSMLRFEATYSGFIQNSVVGNINIDKSGESYVTSDFINTSKFKRIRIGEYVVKQLLNKGIVSSGYPNCNIGYAKPSISTSNYNVAIGDIIKNISPTNNIAYWTYLGDDSWGEVSIISQNSKGSSLQRPILTKNDEGFEYYDTTLKKKILWNGTTWINLDGTLL